MQYRRSLQILLTIRSPLWLLLTFCPNVFAADSVLIRDEDGFAEMMGSSGWREGTSGLQPPASSLLFDNPQQRKSSQWHLGTHRVTGFGLSASSDEEQPGDAFKTEPPRGISWSTSPAKLRNNEFTITGTYIHTPDNNAPGDSPSGSAGAVAVDSSLPLHGEINFHGELAHSDFDPDGSSAGLEAAFGRAFAGELSWLPEIEGPVRLQLNAGLREVDPNFRSATNPFLPTDQRRTHFGASLDRHGFSLQGEVSRTIDNVSENAPTPVQENDAYRLRSEYALSSDSAGKLFALFANPRFGFGVSRNRREDQGNTTGVWPNGEENTTVDFSMAFSPGPAKWSFEQSFSRQESDADFQRDQLTRKSRLEKSFSVYGNVHLSSALEQSRKEYDNGNRLDESSAAFRLSLSGDEGRRTSISLKQELDENSDGSLERTRFSADIRMDRPVPALPGEPKVSIGSSYQNSISSGKESESGYNIFLGLELKLGTTG